MVLVKSLKKLINIGVVDKMSSLNAIRQKFINVLNYMLLVICVGEGILYMYQGETAKIILNIIGFVVFSMSTYHSYKEKMESSILITCTFLNLVVFSSCYFQFFEPVEVMPPTIFTICVTLFLLPNNKIRIFYIVICSVLLTIIVLKYNFKLDKTIPTLVQVIISIIILNFFMIFVETQDSKLNTNVLELEASNLNIERLNENLTIKNKEITGYSHVMSHDLKAPLTNILAYIALIKKMTKWGNSETDTFFSAIEDSAISMNALINDLLNYSKISNEPIQLEEVDIVDIINQVISNFKYDLEYKNITVDVDKLPVINGNKQFLKILFQNLIGNSIKYQPKNDIEHVPTIKIYANSDNQHEHVRISDNGIGIKKDYLKNLFEPFKRFHNNAEYKGTGLGMSICKKVIEKHQGEIKLIETSKNGTTFQLSFKKYL